MRTPRTLDVEITSRCNLHCRYCYFFDNPSVTYTDLPGEEWIRFFDECGACAVMSLTLAGGEPFMRDDLPQLLEAIVRNRMRFSILSNGTLINDEIADFIANTGRCDCIQISVDGSEAEIHDVFRGQGAFDGAIRGIRILQNYEIPVTARVTVHRHNVRKLEALAHLLLDELELPGFSTNSASYFGSCCQNADDVLLNIQERQIAMKTLKRLSEKYAGRISATAGPLAEAKTWAQMQDAYMKGSPPFFSGGYLTACKCYSQKIAVRANGVIVPCWMLAHIELGRINENPLKEVWQHHSTLKRLRQRHMIPLTHFEFCSGCSYIPYCSGNCPGLAYTLTGEVNHPSPDACLRCFLKDGGALEGVEAN